MRLCTGPGGRSEGTGGLEGSEARRAGGSGQQAVPACPLSSSSFSISAQTCVPEHEARYNRVTTRSLGFRQGKGRSNGAEAGRRTELQIAIIQPVDRERQKDGRRGVSWRGARLPFDGRAQPGRRTGAHDGHLTRADAVCCEKELSGGASGWTASCECSGCRRHGH